MRQCTLEYPLTYTCLNSNSILTDNFNSQTISWKSNETDSNSLFYESLDDYDLFININNNKSPYINFYRGKTSNLNLISAINVGDSDARDSEHFPLYFTIITIRDYHKRNSLKIKTVRTVWMKFNSVSESRNPQFFPQEYDILTSCEKYEFSVAETTNALKNFSTSKNTTKNLKPKDGMKNRNPAVWWCSSCEIPNKDKNCSLQYMVNYQKCL